MAVAFRYQSISSAPRPNCALGVLTCIPSLGGTFGKNIVCCFGAQQHSLLSRKKLGSMYLVPNPRCPAAVAIWLKAFDLQIPSKEAAKNNKYFVQLFFKDSRNSKFTLCKNSRFITGRDSTYKKEFAQILIKKLQVLTS